MSGGRFDYVQYRFLEVAEYIEKEIDNNNGESESNRRDYFEPNNFSEETIAEFKKGVDIIKKAFIYTQRIDCLLSGDYREDEFHKRLKAELNG